MILTLLIVTADRIHTFNIWFISVYTFLNRVLVLHVFPDTSIEKDKDRQWTNIHCCKKDKTTTGCASFVDIFFEILFNCEANVLKGSKKSTGAKSRPDDELFGIKEKMSKLNTIYWTLTVQYFSLGWHAFYNQLILPRNSQEKSLCLLIKMRIFVVNQMTERSDYMQSAHGNLLPWYHFIHRNNFLFLIIFLSCYFFCFKQRQVRHHTCVLCRNHTNLSHFTKSRFYLDNDGVGELESAVVIDLLY